MEEIFNIEKMKEIIGQKVKYKDLCQLLDIKYKSGNSKMKQLQDIQLYCKLRKDSSPIRYVIEEVYEEPIKDLRFKKELEIGARYDRLVILGKGENNTKNKYANKYICQCDCGNIVSIEARNLYAGITKSCGCIRKDWRKERGYEYKENFKKRVVNTQRSKMTPKLRYEILKRDNFRCVLCGRNVEEDGVKLEIDHIIPISKGGLTSKENLRCLCKDCNRGKGDKIE